MSDAQLPIPSQISRLPLDRYLKSDGFSNSDLGELARSPMHYYHQRPKPQTDSMIFGSAFHAFLLEGREAFEGRYVEKPKGLRKGTKAYNEFLESMPLGAEVLPAGSTKLVEDMASQAMLHPDVSWLLASGEAESSWYWRDDDTRLVCRMRTDWWNPDAGVIVDLKSWSEVTRDKFEGQAERMDYRRQAAFYVDGARAVLGEDAVKGFVLVAVEKDWPHGTEVYDAEPVLEAGREDYKRLLRVARQCIDRGEWPGYGSVDDDGNLKRQGIRPLRRPAWAQRTERVEDAW